MNGEQITNKSGIATKTLLLILLLTITVFGLVILAFNNMQQKDLNLATTSVTPELENPIQTTLTISSLPVKLSSPSAYSADIIINTGKNKVNKVQLELSYDPKILTKVDIAPAYFFETPQIFLKNINPETGRISFAFGEQDGETGTLGQGILATLYFSSTIRNATASVILLPKTQVTADSYSESVLKSTIDGLFKLNSFPISTKSAN